MTLENLVLKTFSNRISLTERIYNPFWCNRAFFESEELFLLSESIELVHVLWAKRVHRRGSEFLKGGFLTRYELFFQDS